jgi:Phage XkdN-like protein.
MNIVEKLMAVDKQEFEKIETKELESKALSKLLGEDAKVKIQAIDGDLFGSLSASGLDEDGEVDYGRAFSTNAKIVAAGVIEPNLKDEALLKYIGAATPADAAKKIFKGEINKIATEISKLSGFETEETTDKKVKN